MTDCPYCTDNVCVHDICQLYEQLEVLCPGMPTMGCSLSCDILELVRRLIKERDSAEDRVRALYGRLEAASGV